MKSTARLRHLSDLCLRVDRKLHEIFHYLYKYQLAHTIKKNVNEMFEKWIKISAEATKLKLFKL